MDNLQTQIVGTYRKDLKIGEIRTDIHMTNYGEQFRVSIKILRECTEEEYRSTHNYYDDILNSEDAKFYEVVALD